MVAEKNRLGDPQCTFIGNWGSAKIIEEKESRTSSSSILRYRGGEAGHRRNARSERVFPSSAIMSMSVIWDGVTTVG